LASDGFEDVYIHSLPSQTLYLIIFLPSRKSDIENEHLPSELFDTGLEEGRAIIQNFLSTTLANEVPSGTDVLKIVSSGSHGNKIIIFLLIA
jgi:hypothetical protein